MILSLGTLVLLLLKDTMGLLQQNTVLNGTSLVLTWKITMPPGKTFLAFKIYENSIKTEVAVITKESVTVRFPDRLKGRVSNEVLSDFNTSPMVVRLKIGPMMMEDDGLVIMYMVIDTGFGFALSGEDGIIVTTIPYYCDSTVRLNEKYSIQRNSDLRLSTTICGKPMPRVEWKFYDWVVNGELPQTTTHNVTENSKLYFVYNVLLKNVDVRNCGSKVYFNASNEYWYLTGNTTVNITGAPTKITGITASEINKVNKCVTGITAEEVNGVNKCVRVSFNKVNFGLCDISYQVKFVFSNGTELTFTTSNTTVDDCGEGLVNSTVNVAALFNGIVGPYNDVNMQITKLPQPKITSTMQPTMKVQSKYGSIAVVGSFFGGVCLTILIGCAIHFAYRLYAVKSQEESLKSATTDNKEIDNGNYTALDTIQSQRGDYALPSNYTELADLKATKQSIYMNSI